MAMRWKGYGDRRVLTFRKGELGWNVWNEVMWLQRTPENAQDEILHNTIQMFDISLGDHSMVLPAPKNAK